MSLPWRHLFPLQGSKNIGPSGPSQDRTCLHVEESQSAYLSFSFSLPPFSLLVSHPPEGRRGRCANHPTKTPRPMSAIPFLWYGPAAHTECYGLHCVPHQICMLRSLLLIPKKNVTLFGDKVFTDVIKLKRRH